LPAARAFIEKAIGQLKASITAADPFTAALVLDLEKSLEGLKDRSSYTMVGSKAMYAMGTSLIIYYISCLIIQLILSR
jgi:hypothetical protein